MTNAHEKLIEEFRDHGFPISEISDLYNKKYNYKEMVPELIDAVGREENPKNLEEIVRALSVIWAKPAAAKSLVRLFQKVEDGNELGLRWVIGNALSIVADDSVYAEIVNCILQAGYGRSREMLVVALANMKTHDADRILMGLLKDEDLAGHALIAVRKRKSKEALDLARGLENHPKAWVRKEAKKTVGALERIK